MRLQFPEGFLLGVSSASAQIEGGEVGSNWNDWYHQGRIKDGSDPAVADDHWNRWREDCALMAGLHLPVARLGVEWARIMPERGQVDESAVAHYRAELEYLRQLGIRPLLTIHHFSNPMWFERMGAFSKRENLDDFLSFAKLCADRFGDLVSDWITINEPNVYATNGYFFGDWPPGHKKFTETFTVLENMAYCHIRCYRMLHETREAMAIPTPCRLRQPPARLRAGKPPQSGPGRDGEGRRVAVPGRDHRGHDHRHVPLAAAQSLEAAEGRIL